jgi:hypothetical protein
VRRVRKKKSGKSENLKLNLVKSAFRQIWVVKRNTTQMNNPQTTVILMKMKTSQTGKAKQKSAPSTYIYKN